MTILFLAIGGAFGAIARHQTGAFILAHNKHKFPLGTFLINIMGSMILGILCGLHLSGNSYSLLGDGFCGAFTTFSTFSVETVQLIRGRSRKKAAAFIVLSVAIGITLFIAGYQIASYAKH